MWIFRWVANSRKPVCVLGPLLLTRINLNPSMGNNFIHHKVWDEITYPFPNFHGNGTVEVWEWIRNFILHFTGHVILVHEGLKLNRVSEKDSWCPWNVFTHNSPKTMMTSSNGNIFRATGHLCGEVTGLRWIPNKKASDAELWCFLWSASD